MISNDMHHHHRLGFAWKPIIAGALVAIGLSFLLNLFNVAIGLTAFTTDSTGVQTLALGGLIGTSIGTIACMFAAGWIAGYLGIDYCDERHLGALYGFLAWCLALIIAIFLATHAQQYVSFYGDFISGNAGNIELQHSTAMNTTIANVSATKVVISTYILFILFFLGAFGASLGGHCGMRYHCDKHI